MVTATPRGGYPWGSNPIQRATEVCITAKRLAKALLQGGGYEASERGGCGGGFQWIRSVSWKNHRQKPGKSIPKSLNRRRGIKIYTGEVEPSPSSIFFASLKSPFFLPQNQFLVSMLVFRDVYNCYTTSFFKRS